MSNHPIQRSGQLLTVLMAGAVAVSVAVPDGATAQENPRDGAVALGANLDRVERPQQGRLAVEAAPGNEGDCGYCVSGEHPTEGYDTHQFQNVAQPDNFECSGGPSHYLHSCQEGDGSTWPRDSCETDHDECEASQELAARVRAAVGQRIPARHAAALAESHPDRVTYDATSRWVFFRDCDGGIGAMMPAQHPDGAPSESSEDRVAIGAR